MVAFIFTVLMFPIGYGLWMSFFASKSRFSMGLDIMSMSKESFYALASYTAEELKWGVVYLEDDSIRFLTRKSLGSEGEVIILEYINENRVLFYAEYHSQKTGWGQLNSLYPKFKEKFNVIANRLTEEEVESYFNSLIDVYSEFYKKINPDDWSEV